MHFFKVTFLAVLVCFSGVSKAEVCGPKQDIIGVATFKCSGNSFNIEIVNLNTSVKQSNYYNYSVDCNYISKNLNTPRFFIADKLKFAFCNRNGMYLVNLSMTMAPYTNFTTISNSISYDTAEECTAAANAINSRLID